MRRFFRVAVNGFAEPPAAWTATGRLYKQPRRARDRLALSAGRCRKLLSRNESARKVADEVCLLKDRVYIETTVISYLTARRSSDIVAAGHQKTTRSWWRLRRNRFELYCSQFVLDEAEQRDPIAARCRLKKLRHFPLLAATEAVQDLAHRLNPVRRDPSRSRSRCAPHCGRRRPWNGLPVDVESTAHCQRAESQQPERSLCGRKGSRCQSSAHRKN